MKPAAIIAIWAICMTILVVVVVIIVLAVVRKSKNKSTKDGKDVQMNFKTIGTEMEKKDIDEFKRKVRLGKVHAKNHSIVFATILSKKNYLSSVSKVSELGREFSKCRVIVAVELGRKTDDLERFTNVEIVHYKHDKNLEELSYSSPKRNKQIAMIRNMILEYCLEHYRSYDYYCVFDSKLTGQFSNDGFFECFSYSDWHAIACNGLIKKVANDTQFEYIYPDVENYVEKGEDFIQITSSDFRKRIAQIMPPFEIDQNMKRVNSAFGGCIIYPLRILNNCRFVHIFDFNMYRYSSYFYDHSSLHRSMHENDLSKIYVNPKWIVYHY